MANQQTGTPRFFIDFTQLAKLKGYYYWEEDVQNVNKIVSNREERNNNIWNFDLYNPQTYEAIESNPDFYFRLTQDTTFSRIVNQSNWAGFFNHDFSSTLTEQSTMKFGIVNTVENNQSSRTISDSSDFEINCSINKNGFSLGTFSEIGSVYNPDLVYLGLRNASLGEFSVSSALFGRYYDMPQSPDLNITKSISYDGYKINQSLGGSDYVQINNFGSPDWLNGEPFSLSHKDETPSRTGRHGRRMWKLSYSYIDADKVFYDTNRLNTFGDLVSAEGSETNELSAGSEIQQIYDLTLGGALSFIFCPDPSVDNPEIAQCRILQNSLSANQVAYNTWNISMDIIEVW